MKRFNRTLPLLSGLALAGAAAGVLLGNSALGEINPNLFARAPDRFHADLAPQRLDWSAAQASSLAPPTAVDGLGSGCFGCGGARAEYYAAPAIVTYTDSWAAEAERAAAPAEEAYVQESASDPERERVIRYSSYQVDASETPAEPQPAEAEPAAEEVPPGDVTAL